MLSDSQRQKIQSLSDIKPAEDSKPTEDSTWNALSREVYVVGGGIVDGFKSNANARTLMERSPEYAIAAGIGAGLALAQGKSGIVKLGAQVIGLSFAAGMVKDMSDPDRINGLSTAIGDTWNSPENLERNRALVKHHGGDFVFDTTMMVATGMMGAASVKVGRSQAVKDLRSMLGNSVESARGATRGGLSSNAGRTEMLSGVMGSVETAHRGLGATRGRSAAAQIAAEGRGTGLVAPEVTPARTSHLPALEVMPEGTILPNAHSRRLPGNADKMPIAEIHKSEPIKWTFENGKSVDWKVNPEGIEVRLQAQRFVDAFMTGKYSEALKVAVEAPVMERVNLNPSSRRHAETISVSELKQPEILQLRMSSLQQHAEFRWQQVTRDGIAGETKLEVVIPKPIIQLKDGNTQVPLVDFARTERGGYKVTFPEKSTSGVELTPAQVAEIRAVRQSPEGRRLLAETAIFGFEETIVHANQHITQGGRITSPSYAEFARNWGSQSPDLRGHRLSFLGMIDNKHPMRPTIFEQEVPAMLYDAGMPLSVVRHHFFFGGRHVDRRTPVMDFLSNRESILKPQ